jgi:hypothetical protein
VRAAEEQEYQGMRILPVDCADMARLGYAWFIKVKKASGRYFRDCDCPHFQTLAEAEEWIDLGLVESDNVQFTVAAG